jgi:anti-anti-sigma regulatory factor
MILCSADKEGRVLTITHSQHVGAEDMRRCLETVRDHLIDQLKPDFIVLADLSTLESMDASCAPELGAIMELLSARGVSTVVRVIPDPNKDIGLDLISHFHLHPKVRTQTFESLAEAIKSLLAEPLEAAPMNMAS